MKFDRIHANHSWLACSAIIGSHGFGYWTSRVTRSHSSKGNPLKVLGVPCVKITLATSSQASPMLADASVIPRRADFEGEALNEPCPERRTLSYPLRSPAGRPLPNLPDQNSLSVFEHRGVVTLPCEEGEQTAAGGFSGCIDNLAPSVGH